MEWILIIVGILLVSIAVLSMLFSKPKVKKARPKTTKLISSRKAAKAIKKSEARRRPKIRKKEPIKVKEIEVKTGLTEGEIRRIQEEGLGYLDPK